MSVLQWLRPQLILIAVFMLAMVGTIQAHAASHPISFKVLRDVDAKVGISQIEDLFDTALNLQTASSTRSGYGESSLWFKIEDLGAFKIVRAHAILDEISLFVQTKSSAGWTEIRAGDQIVQSERDLISPFMALPIPDNAQREVAYIRVVQPTAVAIKFSGWSLEEFAQFEIEDRNLKTFLFGFIIATILYNLLVSALLKDAIFLFNALTVASLLVFALYLSGYGVSYFWGSWTGWSNFIFVASVYSATLFGGVFMWQFLRSGTEAVVSDWPIAVGPVFATVVVALSVFMPFWATQLLILVAGALLLLCTLLLVLKRVWSADQRARILIFPLLFAVIPGLIIVALERIFGFSLARFGGNTLEITFCIEALLFSLALVARIRITEDAIREANESVLRLKYENSIKGVEVQDNERRRFAKELHDGVGQNFLAVIGGLRAIAAKPDAKGMSPDLTEIADLATSSLNEVRRISRDMHPASIEHLGLKRAIEVLLENLQASEQIEVEIDLQFQREEMTQKAELNIYRIIQESLSNIAHHAEATWCSVRLISKAGRIRLSIEDNGSGLSLNEQGPTGLGLISIDERVHALAGKWSITRRQLGGTLVDVELPLKAGQ